MAIDLNKIHEARRRGFRDPSQITNFKIENILGDLGEIEEDRENYLPRIPERVFVSKYLESFAGLGEDISENYANYLSWITDVAGNYNVAVNVCADNNMNHVLFTVPAIANVNVINPAKSSVREITKAVNTATEVRHMHPHGWEKILEQNLGGILKKVYDANNIVTEGQTIWFEIFKRYEALLKDKHPSIDFNQSLLAQPKDNETKPSTTQADFAEVDDPI